MNSLPDFDSKNVIADQDLSIFNLYTSKHYEYFFSGKVNVFTLRYETIPYNGHVIALQLILYNKNIDKILLLPLAALIKNQQLYFPYFLEPYISKFEKLLQKALKRTLQHFLQSHENIFFLKKIESLSWLQEDSQKLDRYYLCINDIATGIHHLKRYWYLYNNYLQNSNIKSVFELGHGMGYFSNLLSSKYKYYTYDVDLKARELIKKIDLFNRVYLFFDDEYQKQKYDFVFSLEVIEHTTNPLKIVHDLHNLSHNQEIVISLPEETYGGSHLNYDHHTNWNLWRIKRTFSKFFKNIEIALQEVFDFSTNNYFTNSEIETINQMRTFDQYESYIIKLEGESTIKPNIIHLKRTMAMGDALLMEPIIRNLKYKYPDSLIFVYTHYTELFLHNPYIDILCKEKQYGDFEEIITLPLCENRLINLDFAYEKQPNLSIIQAYKKASNLSYCLTECKPTLYFQPLYYKKLKMLFEELVKINPSKIAAITIGRIHDHDRTIPIKILDNVLQTLNKFNVEVVFLLGSKDNYNSCVLPKKTNYPQIIDLVGKTSLHESALILSLCDLFIAPDTGLVHIAATVSCPTIALFGLSLPDKRIDYTTNVIGLLKEDLECIGCLHKTINNINPHCLYSYENFPLCLNIEDKLIQSIETFFSLSCLSYRSSWKEKLKLYI